MCSRVVFSKYLAGSPILVTRGNSVHAVTQSSSMQDEVGVFGVLGCVLLGGGADEVDLEVVFAGVAQAGFGEGGGQALVAQCFGDFGVREHQDISAQRIFQVGDFAVPLDFKAAGGYLLGGARFAAKDIPHGVGSFPPKIVLTALPWVVVQFKFLTRGVTIEKIQTDPLPALDVNDNREGGE